MAGPLGAHPRENPSAHGFDDVTAPTEGSACELHDSGIFGMR